METMWGSHVPAEILWKILKHVTDAEGPVPFLPRASTVSRLWHQVASDEYLWRTCTAVELSHKSIRKEPDVLSWLFSHRLNLRHITQINLSGWNCEGGLNLQAILEECEGLVSINLSHCRVSTSTLEQLLFTANTASTLKEIHFSQMVSEAYCSNLQLLDISYPRSTPYSSHSCAVMFNIDRFQDNCPQLKVFRATDMFLEPSSRLIQSNWTGFPELQEFCIPGYRRTTGHGELLLRFLRGSSKLKLLDVRECLFNMESLQLLRGCAIQCLNLSRCDLKDTTLKQIMTAWVSSLLELDISWNKFSEVVLESCLQTLACEGSQLRTLNLAGTNANPCGVRAVLEKCRKLKSLGLLNCPSLTSDIKRHFQGKVELEDLRRLLDTEAHCSH
ncbi:PREDICTED: F-box/LRR-repeat protein 6-like isoform X2 [Priapulus caudatus]|uniref:F-box/LRR-repeat protein 6-like isoform X2 n=1 Tax=Priapulus caudatus TaxID=37621 RepID=A0ABM1EEW1_PRICU|nr:PREDICTED: F-box/LRR-repeat protein 6-like isoform X2 [Priapulus caudatus]